MIRRFVVATVLGLMLAIGSPGVAAAGFCDADECTPTVQVPEPSSLVLLVSGLGALAWTLRRRR